VAVLILQLLSVALFLPSLVFNPHRPMASVPLKMPKVSLH
jgi:hypothetical protein